MKSSVPNNISLQAAQAIQNKRKVQPNPEELFSALLTGNRVALSQAITLIESTKLEHIALSDKLVSLCLPYANQSVRIGITGIPGVGKSTFIEEFGCFLTSLGNKVAVLAVDPSSSISHGSILGDKTRMEALVKDEKAYIRPSASGTTLGGVARKTRETIMLCEACGYNVILVETVGVGQSETTVNSMVDFFLLLCITGAGDELQGIKRGIMEMANMIVINKADGDNVLKASLTQAELRRALHYFPKKEFDEEPSVLTCSALENRNIDKVWQEIEGYIIKAKKSNYFYEKRSKQNEFWFVETINEQLIQGFYQSSEVQGVMKKFKDQISSNTISPFLAAKNLIDLYFKSILKG